ncbi:aminoglycoside 6-adenylyltransferase [Listeria booriae]|uniref:aminoglycoside 6-adenylyltransferase n=1 Tax=Listeria booriae TaxID=1552123 RepID=UPI001625A5F7|nr:aminoglycoside 6-adenylyltransferase [Listeria booriae]MBC2326019.1 aminoglycoside 6-adenylyltransferase [Listeria booriae]
MLDELLARIIAWAEGEARVGAVVLEGSLAKNEDVDDLSDLDVNIWFEGDLAFGRGTEWLTDIGEVLIENPLDMMSSAGEIRTQLVIFENGEKVDFSFWSVSLLEKPFPYYEKFEMLVDKDNYVAKISKCVTENKKVALAKSEFERIVNEFWFELHYVAKFLKRREVWFVQGIQAGIRENYFLPLFEECARIEGVKTSFSGRKIEKWLPSVFVKRLPCLFAGYDVADGWQVMWEEIALFEEVSLFVARNRDFDLRVAKIEGMKALLKQIQEA